MRSKSPDVDKIGQNLRFSAGFNPTADNVLLSKEQISDRLSQKIVLPLGVNVRGHSLRAICTLPCPRLAVSAPADVDIS
jgi:hypothetical protein